MSSPCIGAYRELSNIKVLECYVLWLIQKDFLAIKSYDQANSELSNMNLLECYVLSLIQKDFKQENLTINQTL